MSYASSNAFGGLTSDEAYPFVDSDGTTTESCDLDGKSVAVTSNKTRTVLANFDTYSTDERIAIMKAAVALQPVSALIASQCNILWSYSSGVLTRDGNCSCAALDCLDHAILVVGYDDNTSTPYWLIKNSWGTDWGENGYFQVAQSGGGNFGLFGLLTEAYMTLEAQNVTAQLPTSGAASVFGGDEGYRAPFGGSWTALTAASFLISATFVLLTYGQIF